ncbi:MAG: MOSC domain-containing protein [Chloroflexi bacterium]|nr:MOSC domain-containing protein [Chloroflexota bacterium]
MPTVARLNIAPVRSLGLESRTEIYLGPTGVAEDRRFFVLDGDRLIDQIIEGTMVQVSAWTDPEATVLRLTFPDGTVVEDAVELTDPIVSPIHKRTAVGHIVAGPWAEALGAFLGRSVRIVRCDRIGGTRVANPATLMTDGSVDALGGVLGVGELDPRRFRMLIELTDGAPHEEDTWLDSRIALGETILKVTGQVGRCAIATHDPDTGKRDFDTLRAIKSYRGQAPDKEIKFGVKAQVETPGVIRLGDEVRVLD